MAILRRSCLAAAAAVGLAWAGRGEAKPVAGIELHWVAPARCPGAEEVRARVRRLLGSDAAGASSGERLVAEGTVVEASGHYRLTLKVRQPDAQPAEVTRVVESTSCDGLAGAAAVILALFARGEARSDGTASPAAPNGTDTPSSVPSSGSAPASSAGSSLPPSREGGPSSGSTPGASPGPQASSPPPSEETQTANAQPLTRVAPPAEASPGPHEVREQERTEGVRWHPALQGPVLVSDVGVLPSGAYGLGAGVGVRVNQLLVVLGGVLWVSQDDTRATPYTATYQRRTGELSGCYLWQYGQFEGGPCLMMTLEDVTADSSGTGIVDRQGHVSWLALGLGAQARWSLAKWAALFLRPTVSFTTSRPTFALDGYGPLYKVPLAAVSVEVGPEWIF